MSPNSLIFWGECNYCGLEIWGSVSPPPEIMHDVLRMHREECPARAEALGYDETEA